MSKQSDLLNKYYECKATEAEKRQLLRMLNHREIWNDDFDEAWEHAFGDICKSTDNRIFKKIEKATKPKRMFPWKYVFSAVVCIGTLFISVLSVHLWKKNEMLIAYAYENATIEVEKGQKSNVVLPDGTQVVLNSDSRLTYGKDFNGIMREVNLQGEAYFQVAPQPHSSFVVRVGELAIQALGTSFNIKAYPDEDKITAYLESGIIVVKSADEVIRVEPHETVFFTPSNGKLSRYVVEDGFSHLAWLSNEMVYEDEPLIEIIKQLERLYNVKFSIKSEELSSITFSGTLKNNSLQSTLYALEFTASIRYKYTPDEIELYMK
ncbi:MAG: FecR family protein [Tannerellaceae bacterium]|nr:FecR family protein [Tannerellaceae bacterium]